MEAQLLTPRRRKLDKEVSGIGHFESNTMELRKPSNLPLKKKSVFMQGSGKISKEK
jgi:hypothetical protein